MENSLYDLSTIGSLKRLWKREWAISYLFKKNPL